MNARGAALPISALLLARDETADIEALLPDLAFAAEVVVAWDANGNPATRDAARAGGARVIERAMEGFGAQRQLALERCSQPWVLWIDADERPGPLVADALRRHLADAEPAFDGLEFLRRTWFLGARIRFCGWGGERIVRLFRREGARFDDAPVHESLRERPARIARDPDLVLEHHSYRTWDDCFAKMRRYGEANAGKAWSEGRRAGIADVIVRPPLRFLRQYVLQLGLLDGWRGLALCAFAAGQVGIKYRSLRARSRREGGRT